MDPQLDSVVERTLSTIARPERVRLLGQILNHLTTQVTILGLFYSPQLVLVADRLPEVTPPYGAGTEAWNAHEWELRN